MAFPQTRLRRLRRNESLRRLVRETQLSVNDLILPLFVRSGSQTRREIESMPGVFQMSAELIVETCKQAAASGIPAIMLFGIPDKKDAVGSNTWDDYGIIQRTVRAIKKESDTPLVITDVCFCEYTDHGHCGIKVDGPDGPTLDNDATLENLRRQAVSHAQAGADMVAPSGMIDGAVLTIRRALDDGGFDQTPIMSYTAKFASAFYGPFRDAAESTPDHGDRKSYQMDPANYNEALREVAQDIEEGADIVMVKPALGYLDVLYRVKQAFSMPTAAYLVSGEYAMLRAASQNGWLDYDTASWETHMAIKRAGADMILTYDAIELAQKLKQ